MKVLNSAEVQNVSGGGATGGLFLIALVGAGLGIYNAFQNKKLEELIDLNMSMSAYQEAQLTLLPHHNEIRSLSLQQVVNIAFN